MSTEKRIYRWYLILAVIYSSILTLGLLSIFFPSLSILVSAETYASIPWLLFNGIMIFIIFKKKIEKWALIIPLLYLLDFLIPFMIGIIFGIKYLMMGLDVSTELEVLAETPFIVFSGAIWPLITFAVVIIFLLRKDRQKRS